MSTGGSLQEALTFGCKVAGWKCGRHGYDGIGDQFGGGRKAGCTQELYVEEEPRLEIIN